MMPYAVLICLAALCGAMLNTFGHFSRPALSPVLLNIAIITAAWLGGLLYAGAPERQICVVALGVLAGGALQLAYQVPALRRRGFQYRFMYGFASPFVRRITYLMAPAIVGVGVTQINIMVDRLLARIVNERGVAVLFYADRLVELPLGVFGIAVATAVLPTISFCAARDDREGFGAGLAFAARQICFIALPATVGLMILAEPIIRLLFERGEFDAASTMYTARALRLYAPGLIGFSFVKVIVPAFYALKDTRTPVRVGVGVLGLNVVLNLILMQFMEERGLALATTICAYVNVGVLGLLLHKRVGTLRLAGLARSAGRIALLTACMGASVWLSLEWSLGIFGTHGLWARLVVTALPTTVGLAVYVMSAFYTRQPELMELLRAYISRRRR
jgi:putative peptidoglycan lipid II flippase